MRVPVIATIIIFRNTNRYVVSLGAYPIWQIALERSLTEAFQGQRPGQFSGTEPLNIDPRFWRKMNYDSYWHNVSRGLGQYPPSLFDDQCDYEFGGFLENRFRTQRETMKYLISVVKDMGYNMYIRDV